MPTPGALKSGPGLNPAPPPFENEATESEGDIAPTAKTDGQFAGRHMGAT
jgi:hypothetical protein